MEQLNTLTSNSLCKVLTKMGKVGYINTSTLYYILALSYLTDLLNDYSDYFSDEGKTIILKAIQCLSNYSCFIDYLDINTFKCNKNKDSSILILASTDINKNLKLL